MIIVMIVIVVLILLIIVVTVIAIVVDTLSGIHQRGVQSEGGAVDGDSII